MPRLTLDLTETETHDMRHALVLALATLESASTALSVHGRAKDADQSHERMQDVQKLIDKLDQAALEAGAPVDLEEIPDAKP